jgi:hypothetical protein
MGKVAKVVPMTFRKLPARFPRQKIQSLSLFNPVSKSLSRFAGNEASLVLPSHKSPITTIQSPPESLDFPPPLCQAHATMHVRGGGLEMGGYHRHGKSNESVHKRDRHPSAQAQPRISASKAMNVKKENPLSSQIVTPLTKNTA